MHSAITPIAVTVKPSDLRNPRTANRTSRPIRSSQPQLHPRRASSRNTAGFPNSRIAALRASSGATPRATCSAISCSRWKRISASRRAVSRSRRNKVANDLRTRSNQRINTSLLTERLADLLTLHHQINRLREPVPHLAFLLELRPFGCRQRIEPRLPARLRLCPLRADPSLLLQSLQRRIKRALLHLQHLIRHLLNPLRNRPAMLRLKRKRLQNQQTQRPLHKIIRLSHTVTIYINVV